MTRFYSRYLWASLFCIGSIAGFLHLLSAGGLRKATVNLESAIAVLFVLSLAVRMRKSADQVMQDHGGLPRWRYIPVVALPFLITLHAPLLYDSYAHVVNASRETWNQLLAFFYQHPTTGDFFFRPIGYIGYWVEAKWAGFSFAIWHADGILLHLVAAGLLYCLGRRLNLSPSASLMAVLFFGIHAGNPEVVTWTAARFDEYTTCFTLASLLFLCRYMDNKAGFAWMLLAALGAMLSKEAAFCLPALALCAIAYRGSPFNRTAWKAFAGLAVLALATLGYRAWVIRGVGGYGAESGDPMALHFNLLRFLQLLFFRMWSVLFFPINWSVPLEWWAIIGILVGLIGLSVAIAVVTPSSRKVIAAIVFCWMALLPASHLGLLNATMSGTRVYHLAVIGTAMLFAAVAEGIHHHTIRALVVSAILALQASVLCHNLLIWRDAALLAGTVCRNFPQTISPAQSVVIENLPREHNGVFFLANAFSACVYVNSGTTVKVLSVSPRQSGLPHFRWNSELRELVEIKGSSK